MRLCSISDSIYMLLCSSPSLSSGRIPIQPYICRDFEKESAIQGFMRIGPRDQDTNPRWPLSSPEAVLVLVSIKNRDFWAGPTPEVLFSLTSR